MRKTGTDKIAALIAKGAPLDRVLDAMQDAMNGVREPLQRAFNEVSPEDWPFLLTALEISAAQLRGHMSEPGLKLAGILKEIVVGVSVIHSPDDGQMPDEEAET